jgi:hypothetical protein
MVGPIGRILGLERAGAETRAFAPHSRTPAAETLYFSARKFSKMVSADKFHLISPYTEPGGRLFQPVAIM